MRQNLAIYRSGPFVDMCDGPHVASTDEIPADAFQLRSVAGAYWRGDAKNAMMTRIYAWAYLSLEELEARRKAHEDAALRDHKKLGSELEIFTFDDEIGRGLPLWLPHGTVIRVIARAICPITPHTCSRSCRCLLWVTRATSIASGR